MSQEKENNNSVNSNNSEHSSAVNHKSIEQINKLKQAKEKLLSNQTIVRK